MNRCSINLGRDCILPAKTRHLIYRTMQIYLTFCGLMMILAGYDAALNVRRSAAFRDEARMIRDQFNLSPAGRYSLLNHADQLQARIEACTKLAADIQEALPSEIHTALPLLNFLLAQSGGSVLSRLTLIQENDKPPVLEFSLTVPAGGRKNPGSGFFQNWQKNPELAKCFASITPVTTRLGSSENSEVFIVNYKAVFKE